MAGSRWGAPCVAAFDWGLWCTPRCLCTWQKEDTTCLENRALVLSTIPLTSLGIEREAPGFWMSCGINGVRALVFSLVASFFAAFSHLLPSDC